MSAVLNFFTFFLFFAFFFLVTCYIIHYLREIYTETLYNITIERNAPVAIKQILGNSGKEKLRFNRKKLLAQGGEPYILKDWYFES